MEANLLRDKLARLTIAVNQLIDELTPSAPDFQLRDACDHLVSSISYSFTCVSLDADGTLKKKQLSIVSEAPEMQGQLVSAHGMLAILEVLEGRGSREVIMRLLQITNLVSTLWIVIFFPTDTPVPCFMLTACALDSWSRPMQAFWRVSA